MVMKTQMTMVNINSGTIMKSIFKYVAFAAIAATAFVSCQEELTTPDQPDAPEVGEVQIKVTAVPEALAGVDTRTYIDNNNTILWGTGEYMKLAFKAGESTTFVNSSDASANSFNGQPQATFGFSITPGESGPYTYMGLYPASAAVANNNTNAANYKVNLPTIQNATASSYDPAAYIMVTKPDTFNEVKTEWMASYRRATALNKITLKNLPSGVSIKRVVITAANKQLAGGRHINLTTGESTDIYSNESTIEVKYATALSGTDVDVWFTSWDVEISAGETLTLVVYTSDDKTYTKEITVPENKSIKFQEGYLNTLGANFSGINPGDAPELEEGAYVVLAKDGSNYYALKAEKEEGKERLLSIDYTGDLTSYVGSADVIWNLTKSGDSYIFENSNKYLGYQGSNNESYWLEAGESWKTNNYLLDVTAQETAGQYYVTVHSNSSRYLSKNSSSAFFAFYGNTGQKADIVFVPATVDTRTAVTLSFDEELMLATSSNYNLFVGQTVIADPNETAITGNISYAMTGDAIGSIDASTGAVILDGSVGTAIVTASFAGNEIYKSAEASYTISVTSATGPRYNLVSTLDEIVAGDYIITWDNKYYLPSGSTSGTNPSVGDGISVADNKIANVVADEMVWTFAGNNTEGFTISDGTNILHSTNSAQGISINTNSTRKWIVSLDPEYGMLLQGDDGGSRYLSVYNNGSWRYYSLGSSYTGTLRLYKLEDNRTPVTLSFANASYSFNESNYDSFTGQTVTSNPSVSRITYSLSGDIIGSITPSTGEVVLNGTAGEATVTAFFAGDGSYKPATASYTISVTAPAATIADALGAPGTYEVPDVAVYAVKGNALILGDASGKIYAFKSSHGLSVGDVRTVSGSTIWYNSGDVYEFDAPTFSGSGTTTISHGTAVEFADNAATLQTETGFASTGSGAAHTAVYVHAIGVQSSRNITTSNGKVLYLSAIESATDGKTVEVYGYVYAYSASHTNFNFLATSIEEYVDPNAKVITALKSSITGISADGVTNATETGVYSLTNASDSDVTVTPDGTVVTSASVSGGALTYSVAANTGAARSGSVTLAVSGGNSIEITISQDKASSSTTSTYVDVLTASCFAATNTTYTDFTNKSASGDNHSSAIYAGNNAKTSGGAIQLRSNNSNAGIVSTTSGGKVKKVVITWGSGNQSGRTITVYGKNAAYSQATDLYGNNAGTSLGTIAVGSTELTITGDYTYIGLRSTNGALYIDKIEVTWEN